MVENIEGENERIERRKKSKFNDDQRKKYCKDYQNSGLTLKKYCEHNNISESALRKWMRNFVTKPLFTPISHRPTINNPHKQSFDIILPSGIRLRFPELVDLFVIKQLIKEIVLCN